MERIAVLLVFNILPYIGRFVLQIYALCDIYVYNYRLFCVMENTEIWLADARNKVTFMFA